MTVPLISWRLLHTPPAHGAWNMAVDEAILEAVGRQTSLPTLRLYAWDPPCLSLGYSQPAADVDRAALAAHGWELVRRPTGGRAILHTDELTYSVIGPPDEPSLSGSLLESYHTLSDALLEALHRLGIPAQALPGPLGAARSSRTTDPSNGNGPVCFEAPSNYEITVNGKKLVGSAQARRKDGVLQHGSLPLYGDLTRITQALVFAGEAERERAASRLLSRATTASEVLGAALAWNTAAAAYVDAFAATLHLDLQPGILTPDEEARALELVETKYGHSGWTDRV